jgi:hypothetical protein
VSNFKSVLLIIFFLTFIACAIRLVMAKNHDDKSAKVIGEVSLQESVENSSSSAMLNRSGDRYALEVRGLGVTAWKLISYEIWNALKNQESPYDAFISSNPKDYPYDWMAQSSNAAHTSAIVFRAAMKRAVYNWPLPTYIVVPPLGDVRQTHAGGKIPGMRQAASLATHLPTDQGSASTNDSAAIWHEVFTLFEAHPDLPEAVIFVGEGETVRIGRLPLSLPLPKGGNGHRVPSAPDSYSAFLVARSDHVSQKVRELATRDEKKRSSSTIEEDVGKQWHFYWRKNDGRGEDGYEAYWKANVKPKEWRGSIGAGQMTTAWWQAQLPEFWKSLGPARNGFVRSGYFPLPWTSWQLKAFDAAPLIGYIHKPVTVDLSSDDGRPLNRIETTKRLRVGLERAFAAAEITPTMAERVFYDSSEDKLWVIPLSKAVDEATQSNLDAMSLTQGFDIGVRIGNTGINAPYMQMGLGLIASYLDGGTSVSIARRPGEKVDIVVLSPPAPNSAEAHQDVKTKQKNFLP